MDIVIVPRYSRYCETSHNLGCLRNKNKIIRTTKVTFSVFYHCQGNAVAVTQFTFITSFYHVEFTPKMIVFNTPYK